ERAHAVRGKCPKIGYRPIVSVEPPSARARSTYLPHFYCYPASIGRPCHHGFTGLFARSSPIAHTGFFRPRDDRVRVIGHHFPPSSRAHKLSYLSHCDRTQRIEVVPP